MKSKVVEGCTGYYTKLWDKRYFTRKCFFKNTTYRFGILRTCIEKTDQSAPKQTNRLYFFPGSFYPRFDNGRIAQIVQVYVFTTNNYYIN